MSKHSTPPPLVPMANSAACCRGAHAAHVTSSACEDWQQILMILLQIQLGLQWLVVQPSSPHNCSAAACPSTIEWWQ